MAELLDIAPPQPISRPRPQIPERSARQQSISVLLLAAPAIWIGILIFLYGVDSPWGDQWDGSLPVIQKMYAGTLRVSDFFAFHNEHRIVFPRLIMLGLAQLTHWNVRFEMLVIWLLLCVCSLNVWRLTRVTGWQSSRSRDWLLLASNLMLFSPLQWENLVWGFQIGFILPLACLTTCIWVARSGRASVAFLVTMALSFVCTLSVASGFSCWLLTLPILLFCRSRSRSHAIWTSIWVVVGTVTTYLYFHGYKRPAAHPSALEVLKHPFRAVQFTLAYLGNPFSSGTALDPTSIATIAGTTLLVALASCLFYLWHSRHDRLLLSRSLPWVSLAGWAIINALLTTIGRLGFGTPAALQSRYVSFAIVLPIGLLFLIKLIYEHRNDGSPHESPATHGGVWPVAVATAFAILFLCASIRSLQDWKGFQHARLSGKAAVLLVNVVEDNEILSDYVHYADPELKNRINFLEHVGFLRPRLVSSPRVREIAYRSRGDNGQFKRLTKMSADGFGAAGWAILPAKHRVADMVLLTYNDAGGEPIVFAMADVRYPTTDVAQSLGDSAYDRSGWYKSWGPEQLPANAGSIRAWAFDAEDCRAFFIGGAPKLN